MVPGPTPTDQAGPQKITAMPSPTMDRIPAQTQCVDPPADSPTTKDPPAEDPSKDSGGGNGLIGSPDHSSSSIDDLNSDPSDPNPDRSREADSPQGNPGSPNPSKVTPSDNKPLPATAVVAIGHQTFTALPNGGFKAAGATIQPGDPTVTIQGTPVWLGSSMLVACSSTIFLPKGEISGPLTAGNLAFTPLEEGTIVVQGNTLSVDGLATSISGKAVSLDSSGIVIDSQTFAIPRPAPEATHPNNVFTVAGHTVSQDGTSKAFVDGVMLDMNGQAKTVSGTALALIPGSLIIDGQKYALPTPAPKGIPASGAVYTTAGQTVSFLGDGSAMVDGVLFSVNGPAVTVSGTTISLASPDLVVNGQSYALPAVPTATVSNGIMIDGKLFKAGGPAIEISGHLLKLVSGDSGLYITKLDKQQSEFSIPVTAGESMTLDASGIPTGIIASGKSGLGNDDQSLGSLVMFGFGQYDQTSAPPSTSSAIVSPQGSSTSTPLPDQFTGDGARNRPLIRLEVLCLVFLIRLFVSSIDHSSIDLLI